jgi:hypothetical protein
MSTRSRIGIVREFDAKHMVVVESIYCHFDGYPEGVGQMLLDHWTDEAKINRLIALGDLSSLGRVIGRKHDFDTHLGTYVGGRPHDHPDGYDAGTFVPSEAAKKGWCLFYGRDRGEPDTTSRVHEIDDFPDYGQEAEYLFDPSTGTWRVRRQDKNPVGWNTVTPWEGWITIPEAIELEANARAEWEASRA